MSKQLNNEKYNVLEDPLDSTNQSEKQKEKETEKQHIVMPMNIEYNTQKPLPEDLKEFLSDFTKLKSSLNCWIYVNVVLLVLVSIGFIRYFYEFDLFRFIAQISYLIDYVFWIIGLKKGRKTCNEFKLEELQKLPKFLKISSILATLNIVVYINFALREFEGYRDIDIFQSVCIGVAVTFYIIFIVARFYKHINPSTKISQQIKEFSLKYPENNQGFTFITVLRQHIPYKN